MVTTSPKISDGLKLGAPQTGEAIVVTDGYNPAMSAVPPSLEQVRADQRRRIGILDGKAEVDFGRDFTMTDEGLLDA